ncbi:MAG: class I SAM-dependent methyltransferase [Minwuiales bacterium]|nr:class I SAM-dependent methyltransferase [Minwuiales bacterium]
MDYDNTNIAAVYDSGRGYNPEILRQWLKLLSDHVPKDGISRIIDLGCGTGRFTEPLSVHFEAEVIGIDPSEKMLEQARRKNSGSAVSFKQASGGNLPLEERSTDMVFMSMVFHHLPDPEHTMLECHRILRDGGYVCIRDSTLDVIETFPYLRFFDGIRPIVEEQLISRIQMKNIVEGAGFGTVTHKPVTHQMSPNWRTFAEKMALRADSFVARLPDDVFEKGMTGLRAYAEHEDSGEPVTEEVDFFVFQR